MNLGHVRHAVQRQTYLFSKNCSSKTRSIFDHKQNRLL